VVPYAGGGEYKGQEVVVVVVVVVWIESLSACIHVHRVCESDEVNEVLPSAKTRVYVEEVLDRVPMIRHRRVNGNRHKKHPSTSSRVEWERRGPVIGRVVLPLFVDWTYPQSGDAQPLRNKPDHHPSIHPFIHSLTHAVRARDEGVAVVP